MSDTSTEFSGRRALVTGCSRSVGASIAQRLLDSGAKVVTAARTPTDDTPADSTFITADVRTDGGAQELVAKSIEAMGGLDILANNAGASRVFGGGATTIPPQTILDSIGAPMEAVAGQIPLGRRGVTSHIAEMVAFLLSERASWITGTNFIVDGGATGSR